MSPRAPFSGDDGSLDALTLVRVGSHRAREKLSRLLGRDPEATYFSWHRPGSWALIPPGKLAEALEITGISQGPRKRDDLRAHWPKSY